MTLNMLYRYIGIFLLFLSAAASLNAFWKIVTLHQQHDLSLMITPFCLGVLGLWVLSLGIEDGRTSKKAKIKSEDEEQYVEVAIRIKRSDWERLDDNEFHRKMWKNKNNNDTTVRLCVDCEVLVFGVDGFISSKIN